MILAVTGHRPPKLGGYNARAQAVLTEFAYEQLSIAAPEQVITGMALGWDTAIAEACRRLGVPYHAYIPFEGQESQWPGRSQADYKYLLIHAASVVTVCTDGYAPWKMQKRNEAMVDKCDSLLALWNGTDGGTANCVMYAYEVGRPVSNCWDDWIAASAELRA